MTYFLLGILTIILIIVLVIALIVYNISKKFSIIETIKDIVLILKNYNKKDK